MDFREIGAPGCSGASILLTGLWQGWERFPPQLLHPGASAQHPLQSRGLGQIEGSGPSLAMGRWVPSFPAPCGLSHARGTARAEASCCGSLLCWLSTLWGIFLLSTLRQVFALH